MCIVTCTMYYTAYVLTADLSMSSSLMVALFLANLFALIAAIFSTDIASLRERFTVIAPPSFLAPSFSANRCYRNNKCTSGLPHH